MVAASMSSCKDDMYNNEPNEPLKLSVDSITVNKKAQIAYIGVTARDGDWTMTGSEEWCTVSPASGGKGVTRVAVTFTANGSEEAEGEEETAVRTATFTFSSGGQEKSVAVKQLDIDILLPNPHPDYEINQLIHEELATWYYNGEPGDSSTAADFNQEYATFYFKFLSTLKRNTLDVKEWSMKLNERNDKKYIYSYIERNPEGTADRMPLKLNYGMEFDLTDQYGGVLAGRILYVEKGSPAERGDWFHKVNDVSLGNWIERATDDYQYNRLIDTLVHPILGESPKLGMLSFSTLGGGQLVDEKKTVTLSSELFANNPILGTQTFEVERLAALGGGVVNVGYLMYNSFDPAYENELINTFRNTFKRPEGQELDNFILDLRYNKNGSVEMAELLGNLLVGNVEGVTGKTFAKYEFAADTGVSSNGRTALFADHEESIGVDTVFVLTSKHTAGASELLINALRGLDQSVVKLVVVGEKTQGLAAGMVKRTVHNPGDEWEYSAWMLAFTCKNDKGNGDYTYGLAPNGGEEVSEWERGENIKWSTTWEWKGRLGSTEDPLIRHAVDMIAGRKFIPAGDVTNAGKSDRRGFPRQFCFPTNMVMELSE